MYEWKVKIEDGIMKVRRFTEPCKSSESFPVIFEAPNFLPEIQLEESKNYGANDEYEEFEPENWEGIF